MSGPIPTPVLELAALSISVARLSIGIASLDTYSIEIERSDNGGAFGNVETITGSGTVSWSDNSVGDGTAYLWRVRLSDGLGNYGAYSNEVGGTTPLPAADGFWATGAPTSVALHWTRRAQNNTGVKVWRTHEGGSTFYLIYTGTDPTQVSYDDSGPLVPSQNYKYYLETYNAIAAAQTPDINVFTEDPPNAPSLPTLVALLTTALRAGWQDNSDNELGFTVEWGTDGATFPNSATVGPGITTYDITGLSSNTRYYARIKATNASGSSAYTSIISCSTLAAVAQPGLAVTPWGAGRIECVLRDCSELETDHRIERRTLDYILEKIVDGALENWAAGTGSQTYTSGSGNWTVPAGVTSINVYCIGGGAGGGNDDSTLGAGGGGGGGAYAKKLGVSVTPGASIPYVVGAAVGTDTDGNDTTFNSTVCVAKGGKKGQPGYGTRAGGAGGLASASTGDTKYDGGAGGNGYNGYGGGGGSGSSAGTGAAGGNGGNGASGAGGSAGSAPTGGGAGATGGAPDSGGTAGTAPGGGGSGAGTRSSGAHNGGGGAAGKIVITWSTTPTDLTSWDESVAGSSTIKQEATEKYSGSFSAKLSIDGSNSVARIAQTNTLTANWPHRLRFRYKNSAAGKTAALIIKDAASNVYLTSAGTWSATPQGISVPNSTSWALFSLSFTTHASYTSYFASFGNPSGAGASLASSDLYLDEISIMAYGAFAEIATLEPNREFYPDTGLTAGMTYEYRARARQSGSPDVYSAYTDAVSATVLSAPAAPTAPAVSAYQDKQVWLTWVKSASGDEAGYEIYKALSGGSFSLYRTVMAGVESCRVSGLSPSTAYDFKIRAISQAGNSAYTSVVSQTTRAAYLRSDFEKLQLQTKPADWVNLIRINPTITLAGWALASGKTYTYQKTLSESIGIRIEGMTENGEDLDIKASIAEVEAAAGSFYFDYAAQTVYVHPSGSDNPIDYYYLGSFWKHFSTGDPRATGTRQPIVFNGDHYLPLVPTDGIPDITQAIEPYYKGSYIPTHGSLSIINGISPAWGNVGYFDKLGSRYNWKGRMVQVLGGRASWTLSQFYSFSSGVIDSKNFSDQRAMFTLRDYRTSLNRDLPKHDYWESEFPNLDATNARGKVRPKHWGAVVGFAPVCIDTVNRVFELNNGRISNSAILNVYQNDVVLTAGTDYYIDYQRGRITLSRSLVYASTDKITADFTATVDCMDLAIQIGPLILLDLFHIEVDLALAHIDLDAFYDAAETATTNLVLSLDKSRSLDSCIEFIEKSCMGWVYQDNLGRLALRLQQTAATSGILYIPNARIKDGFAVDDPEDNTYAGVDIGFAEDQGGTFQTIRIPNNIAKWRDGAQDMLPINTLIPTAAGAAALGAQVIPELNKPTSSFEVDRCLYTAMPGDLAYFTRSRYFSESGIASNLLVRLLSLTKSDAHGSTSGTFQEV